MTRNNLNQFKYLSLSIYLSLLFLSMFAFCWAEESKELLDNSKVAEDIWKKMTNEAVDLLKQGKIEDAIKISEELLLLTKNSGNSDHAIINKSINNLARVYLSACNHYNFDGQFDKVILFCNKTIDIMPDSKLLAEAFINKGMAYSWSDLDKALLNFNKAIEINPELGHYYLGRAGIYIKLACADLKRACSDFNLCDEYNQAKENDICEKYGN